MERERDGDRGKMRRVERKEACGWSECVWIYLGFFCCCFSPRELHCCRSTLVMQNESGNTTRFYSFTFNLYADGLYRFWCFFFFLMRVCEYSGCATVFLFVCLKSHDIITAITFVPLFVANMDLVFRIYEAHAHLRSHVYFCRVMCFSYIDLA